MEEDDSDWEAKIDEQYERYPEARRRLIHSVEGLRAPLPEKEPEMAGSENLELPLSASVQHSGATEMVNAVEARMLASMQEQGISQAHLIATDEQVQKETATTTSMLERLGDTSRLLLAFPTLSHPGRFEHAASTVGRKGDRTEDKAHDATSRHLKLWLFAAQAADATSADTMQKHLLKGNKALGAVARDLAELRLLKDSVS